MSTGLAVVSRLCFERFDERFLERSWEWLNDPEVKRLTMTPDFTRMEQLHWFAHLPAVTDYLIWGISYDGILIGALGLKSVTAADAEYWGYIGDRRYWGKGLGAEMVRFALEKAHQLGLSRLYLKVRSDNSRAIRLYTKVGFSIICTEESIVNMWMCLRNADEP